MRFNKFAFSLLVLCSAVALVRAGECRLDMSGPRLMLLHSEAGYTIVLHCQGNTPLRRVRIVMSPGEYMDYISSSPQGACMPGSSGQPASVVWEFPELDAASTELKVVMRAKKTGLSRIVVAVTGDSVAGAEAHAETQVIGVPALHVSSYDTEDPVDVGESTVYVIEMRNEGTAPVTNTRLEHVISGIMEFADARGPMAFRREQGKVVFEPCPILQPGEKLTYRVTVKAMKTGAAIGRSLVTYDQFEKPLCFDEVTSVSKSSPAMHSSSYDTEDPLQVGKSTIYVVELRNEGNVPCNNLELTDIIPEQTEFLGAEGPVPHRCENGRVVFDPVPVLQPGERLSYKVKVKAVKIGSAKNVFLWSCDQLSDEIRDEEGTSIYR